MDGFKKGWNEKMTLEDTKNLAYWERNMLALFLAQTINARQILSALMDKKEIVSADLRCGWYYDTENDWDGWRRVISILDGKITFHIPDDFDVGSLLQIEPNWDGHTTEEKWERIMKMVGIK